MKALIALVALSSTVLARPQNPRYEFLWRLRQLEQRWAKFQMVERRSKALDFVVKAQSKYAGGDVEECCRALDSGSRALSGAYNGNDSIKIIPLRRICDSTDAKLDVTLGREYRAETGAHITFTAEAGETELGLDDFWFTERTGSWGSELSVGDLVPGDHAVILGLFDGDLDSSTRYVTISIVEHRDERLAALKAGIEKLGDKAPALERETAKATLEVLDRLAHGSKEAHEYPAAQMLEETEKVVAAAAKGERWYSMQDVGEHWLVLPLEGANVLTRVLVPDGLNKDHGAPLVVAFHGAAFDEDVWFDGYGAGAGPKFAKERGWLFAAVHSDGEDAPQRVEAIVAALAGIYPVDAKHVFLLGHSRGARTALRACAAAPERYAGVAAIGNAIEDASAKTLANQPLFLAAGDHDPAREAVTAMAKSLADAGSKTTKLTIYPDVEHWLCVQAALPDAFTWFDTLAN